MHVLCQAVIHLPLHSVRMFLEPMDSSSIQAGFLMQHSPATNYNTLAASSLSVPPAFLPDLLARLNPAGCEAVRSIHAHDLQELLISWPNTALDLARIPTSAAQAAADLHMQACMAIYTDVWPPGERTIEVG